MMYTSTLATLALLSVASAQSTVSLFLPGFDKQALEAAIVGSKSALTTYAVSCAPTVTDSNECGIASALTITQGASTMHFQYGADDGRGSQETIDLACQITDSKTAACTGSAVGTIGTSTISSQEATTITDANQFYMAVTVTTAANTAGATGGSKSSSSTSNGAMPMITGNAWVAGGAACAIALAAM